MICNRILNKYLGDARKVLVVLAFIFCGFNMLLRLGLLVIIISRLIQLNYSRSGKKEIQSGFLLLQAIGIFLLVIGSFATGDALLGFLNLLSAAGAFGLYMKLKK